MVRGLLTVLASLIAVLGLSSAGSVVVAHQASLPVACRIFLDQQLNLCLPALAGRFLVKKSQDSLSFDHILDGGVPWGLSMVGAEYTHILGSSSSPRWGRASEQ